MLNAVESPTNGEGCARGCAGVRSRPDSCASGSGPEEGERLRRCPNSTVQDYIESGLLRVCQPSRYGGYDLGYDVLCEVIQTLARGDGSQAWVYMVLADNALKLAAYDLSAQDDVWGQDNTKRLCVAVSPVGRATPVDGGVLWNGVHGFSSGIDHADWVMCGGFEYDAEGRKGRGLSALMPTNEVKVIDDWHVVGLAGTGSKSFEVRNVFVPAHRILDKQASDEGRAPGALLHSAPATRLPRGGVSAATYTAVVVGVAQGLLQEFLRITGPRRSRGTRSQRMSPFRQVSAKRLQRSRRPSECILARYAKRWKSFRGGRRSATSSIFKGSGTRVMRPSSVSTRCSAFIISRAGVRCTSIVHCNVCSVTVSPPQHIFRWFGRAPLRTMGSMP